MLLTFEQYKLLVPNTECYIPAEVLVVMESTVVPLHSIYGLDDTPVHLIKWNSAFDNFTRWTALSRYFNCMFWLMLEVAYSLHY